MRYRWWILVAVGLFTVGIMLGLVMPDDTASVFSEDIAALQELARFLGPFQLSTAAFYIYLKQKL